MIGRQRQNDIEKQISSLRMKGVPPAFCQFGRPSFGDRIVQPAFQHKRILFSRPTESMVRIIIG
jgi:hypothetical protein